jgi:hypothetical protein
MSSDLGDLIDNLVDIYDTLLDEVIDSQVQSRNLVLRYNVWRRGGFG